MGSHIAGFCVNHISYAGDMVIRVPYVKALQMLLNKCSDFASFNDVVYNSTKTVCMTFRSRSFKEFNAQKFKSNGYDLEFTEEIRGCIQCDFTLADL